MADEPLVDRTDDDLECFEHTVRSGYPQASGSNGVGSSRGTSADVETALSDAYRLAELPLKLSSVCRRVHSVLTSPSARKRRAIDEKGLMRLWADMDRFWDQFTERGAANVSKTGWVEEGDVYACTWQMFLFECCKLSNVAFCYIRSHHI